MKQLSDNLDDYTLGEIKKFALKHIKATNIQIEYYTSEHGKAKYREGSKRYYWKHREKCLERAKRNHKKKVLASGKVPQNRRGRPSKKVNQNE